MMCGDVVAFVLWDKVEENSAKMGRTCTMQTLSVSGGQPSFLLRLGEHDMSRAAWASVETQWRCAGERR